jgi:hypothetical protein
MALPHIDGQHLLFDHVDKSLAQLRIPPSLLRQLREVDGFKSHDFQLDGVDAVDEDGTHKETPETVRPNFEWRKYGAPGIGLQWRQVPVDDTVGVYNRHLDDETMAKQKRMSERAFHAYLHGGGGFMGDRTLEKVFMVPDRERDRRMKELQKSREITGELRERMDAAKVIRYNAPPFPIACLARGRVLLPVIFSLTWACWVADVASKGSQHAASANVPVALHSATGSVPTASYAGQQKVNEAR